MGRSVKAFLFIQPQNEELPIPTVDLGLIDRIRGIIHAEPNKQFVRDKRLLQLEPDRVVSLSSATDRIRRHCGCAYGKNPTGLQFYRRCSHDADHYQQGNQREQDPRFQSNPHIFPQGFWS